MPCSLCLELYKRLCHIKGKDNPKLCEIYEDYATGKIQGKAALDLLDKVIEIVGEDEVERIGIEVINDAKE